MYVVQVYFEKRAIRICVGSYTKEFAFVTVFWEFNVKPKFTPKAKTTEIQNEIFQEVVVGGYDKHIGGIHGNDIV